MLGQGGQGDDPINFKGLYSVERFGDHKKMLKLSGPAIYYHCR